jgi:NAD(P)-dependent dehydrogenase (short-subunit alcohol dehydrogenase family)
VRVNALNPGAVRTAMRRQAYPAEDLGRLASPESVAAPYVALLSDACAGVTGGSFNCQPQPPDR